MIKALKRGDFLPPSKGSDWCAVCGEGLQELQRAHSPHGTSRGLWGVQPKPVLFQFHSSPTGDLWKISVRCTPSLCSSSPMEAPCLHLRPSAMGQPGNSGGSRWWQRAGAEASSWGWGWVALPWPISTRLPRRITNPVISALITPFRCCCSQLHALSSPKACD